MHHIFKFILTLIIILFLPFSAAHAQTSTLNVEREKALKAYNEYGAIDGSTFEDALANKKIIEYHIFFKNNQGSDLKTRQSVINKYTSGRFSQYTDTSRSNSRSRSSSANQTATIKPYSFRNQLSKSTQVSNSQASNRFSGSRYENRGSNRGYSLSLSPEQVIESRERALERANQ